MAPAAQAVPIGQPMSWDEYVKLGPDVRGEYIDGNLIASPSPNRIHQDICIRLVMLLMSALPAGFKATTGWAWKPTKDEFIPDVMVYGRTDETTRYTGTPELAIEVVSSNRSDDLVIKTQKYAAAGLPHYWIVDPRDALLTAYTLTESGIYEHSARLALDDEELPASGEVSFGVGSVFVDLDALLGDL